MRKIFKKSNLMILVFSIMLLSPMVVSASSHTFEGTMYYRVLNGSANNRYYSFSANKTMTLSGSVKVIDTDNYGGTPSTTFVCCYEKTDSGSGNKICEDSVVAYYDGNFYSFYDTGTTINTSDKYYIMCYKNEDDGFDIQISGTISTN